MWGCGHSSPGALHCLTMSAVGLWRTLTSCRAHVLIPNFRGQLQPEKPCRPLSGQALLQQAKAVGRVSCPGKMKLWMKPWRMKVVGKPSLVWFLASNHIAAFFPAEKSGSAPSGGPSRLSSSSSSESGSSSSSGSSSDSSDSEWVTDTYTQNTKWTSLSPMLCSVPFSP